MIKFEKISIKFNEKTIFDNLDLSIKAGEKIVIIGDSGAGKSTLLNLILGFRKQNSGNIFIDDLKVNIQNISKLRKKISFVPQNVNLPFDLAKDLFESQFLYSKMSIPSKEIIEKTFNDFNLSFNILESSVPNLSGGEKQRILLIASLLTNKKILLWDEPTSALDFKNKETLLKYVNKMSEKTILSISHDDFWIDNLTRVVKL